MSTNNWWDHKLVIIWLPHLCTVIHFNPQLQPRGQESNHLICSTKDTQCQKLCGWNSQCHPPVYLHPGITYPLFFHCFSFSTLYMYLKYSPNIFFRQPIAYHTLHLPGTQASYSMNIFQTCHKASCFISSNQYLIPRSRNILSVLKFQTKGKKTGLTKSLTTFCFCLFVAHNKFLQFTVMLKTAKIQSSLKNQMTNYKLCSRHSTVHFIPNQKAFRHISTSLKT